MILTWAHRLARRQFGPVLLAVLFALASLPIVMLEVPGYDPATFTHWSDSPRLPFLDPAFLLASIGAVVAAAVVASSALMGLVRQHATLGAMFTIPVAWATAICALPMLPAVFGLRYGAVSDCIDSCNLEITGFATGYDAFRAGWWLSWTFAPWTLGTLVVGVVIWAWIVRRATLGEDLAEPPPARLDTYLQIAALALTALGVVLLVNGLPVDTTEAILVALPLVALVGLSYIARGLPARVAACLAVLTAASACVGTVGAMLVGPG